MEPATAFGDGSIALIGHDLLVDEDGDEKVLRLSLVWQARDAVDADYHIFVHLVDGEGKLVAQSDGVPVYDRYPFSQWSPGEVVPDRYDVPLPDGVPPAEAEVRIGLYDFATGERLPVGSSDYLALCVPDGPMAP
jgi:hypothetical protein